MEKFLENLNRISYNLYKINHILNITFPLIKNKNLLLNILIGIKKSVVDSINLILQYEYLYRNIDIHSDFNLNFKIFITQCSPKYQISNKEIQLIEELFEIVRQQKSSSMNILNGTKIVILSENMQKTDLEYEKLREFLELGKILLKRTKSQFLRKI